MASDANVRVVISAITEAAEQAIEEVGQDLTGLADDSAVAQSGLDQVSDEMTEATSRASVLQAMLDEVADEMSMTSIMASLLANRLDEVGDESAQAAAAGYTASSAFSSMSLSSSGASVSVGVLGSTISTVLIPALAILSTMIFPIAAALGTLAAAAASLGGAFATIVGSGFLAYGKQLAKQNQQQLEQVNSRIQRLKELKQTTEGLTQAQQKQLQKLKKQQKRLEEATSASGALAMRFNQLKKEITPLIVQFGKQFVPLIRDAVQAIPALVKQMLAAVGGVQQFKNALRDLGGAAMQAIPQLFGAMFEMARQALPVMMDLIRWIGQEGPSAFQAMVSTAREVGPTLIDLVGAFLDILPALNRFGTTVLQTVVPAISQFMNWMGESEGMGTIFREVSKAVKELSGPFNRLIDAVAGMIPFIASMAEQYLPLLVDTISAVVTSVAMLIEAWNSLDGAVKVGLIVAAGAALAVLSGGTLAVVGAVVAAVVIVKEFMDLLDRLGPIVKRSIDQAQAAWNQFKRQVQNVFRSVVSEIRGFVRSAIRTFRGIVRYLTQKLPKQIAKGMALAGIALLTLLTDVETAKAVVRTLGEAWNTAQKAITNAINTAQRMVANLKKAFDKAIQPIITLFTQTLPRKINQAVTVIEKALQPLVNFFTRTLPQMAIKGLVNVLATVQQVSNRIHNVFASLWNGVVAMMQDAIQAMLNTIVQGINSWLGEIEKVANTVESVTGQSLPDIAKLQTPQIQAQAFQAEQRTTTPRKIRRQTAQEIVATLNLDVGGEGPLAEFIREKARVETENTFDEKQRKVDRNNVLGT